MNIQSDAKVRNFCFKNFKNISYTFRTGRLVEGGGGVYRGPSDGGYILFYLVLNLVLTWFKVKQNIIQFRLC